MNVIKRLLVLILFIGLVLQTAVYWLQVKNRQQLLSTIENKTDQAMMLMTTKNVVCNSTWNEDDDARTADQLVAIKYMRADAKKYAKQHNQCKYKQTDMFTVSNRSYNTIKLSRTHLYLFERHDAQCTTVRFTYDNWSFREFEKFQMNRKTNYTLALAKSGHYYVKCQANKTKKTFFKGVYTLLPSNWSMTLIEHGSRLNTTTKRDPSDDSPVPLTGISRQDSDAQHTNIDRKLNVLIIGIDSLSRSHFRRAMPLTYKYLSKMKHNTVYTRVNSVGINSSPNIIPLFTGIVIQPVHAKNIKNEEGKYKKNSVGDQQKDHYPYLWLDYETRGGYVTSWQQDLTMPQVIQTTVFDYRPFWLKYAEIKNKKFCNNAVPIYKTFIDQIVTFVERMDDHEVPYFFFNFLTNYTHDYMHVPRDMDMAFERMFKQLEHKGHLANTLLIVFADHGNRLKPFSYETEMGLRERYLPFVSMRLPKPLRQTYMATNAKQNGNRLISFFDLYQTMRHYLHVNMLRTTRLDTRQYRNQSLTIRHLRGISLFEHIPVNRTCGDALVDHAQCILPECQRVNLTEADLVKRTRFDFNSTGSTIGGLLDNMVDKYRHLCRAHNNVHIQTVKYTHVSDLYQFIVKSHGMWYEVYLVYDVKNKTGVGQFRQYNVINRLSVHKGRTCIDNNDYLQYFCSCKNAQVY